MTPIIDSLTAQGIDDIVIWNNAEREDLGIYGRYAAITEAKHDVIVTQDDDLIVNCYAELLAGYRQDTLRCNYYEPWDVPWPSIGSVFDAHLPQLAFDRYFQHYEMDRLFTHRICDIVFALLTDEVEVEYWGHENRPHGLQPGRVSTGGNWYGGDRTEGQRRCREILDRAAA